MDMELFRTRKREPMNSLSVFTHSEIMEMENLIKHAGQQSLSQEFFQDLATSFSCTPIRAGKPDITWEQVQSWFQNKQKELQANSNSSPTALELFVDLSDSNVSSNATENSQKPKAVNFKSLFEAFGLIIAAIFFRWQPSHIVFTGKWSTELHELAFEARSAKDDAWYDVASFLSYRVVNSGELEVRVRYSGFGREDDEWVNVTRAVRERSIPLEASECHKVKVGDLVLSFQEREHQAVYCDAHVVDIQRGLHDVTGCKCIFVVRFDHDNTEEEIQLRRLCIRPAQNASAVTNTQQHDLFRNKDMKFSFLY